MPIYAVVMEQGISMKNLGANRLMTGFRPDDAILNCSVVILSNPVTGSAGLYHFPSGDIEQDNGSQDLLCKMHTDVNPAEIYVIHGASSGKLSPDAAKLTNWLQGRFTMKPVESHTISVSVAIHIENGKSFITEGLSNITGGDNEKVTSLHGYVIPTHLDGIIKIYRKTDDDFAFDSP